MLCWTCAPAVRPVGRAALGIFSRGKHDRLRRPTGWARPKNLSGQGPEPKSEEASPGQITQASEVCSAKFKGVARNLLQGDKRGVWGMGSRGRAPVGSGVKPPEAGDTC